MGNKEEEFLEFRSDNLSYNSLSRILILLPQIINSYFAFPSTNDKIIEIIFRIEREKIKKGFEEGDYYRLRALLLREK